MLNYLSKFILQMLPTISATVIGAYIVATWIDPKTPPQPPKVAARAQEPTKTEPAKTEPAAAQSASAQTSPAQTSSAQEAAVEPVDAKPVETVKPVKGASAPEKVRVIPLAKQPAETVTSTASVPAAEASMTAEERKDANRDANELARAAIIRLRGGETARGTDEPPKPAASVVRTQQARVAPEVVPLPVATIAPPLPPAVSIAAPRVGPGENVDQAAGAYPDRMSPPAEIPVARNPLNLQASARMADNPSIADDFVSATKSFFRALTP